MADASAAAARVEQLLRAARQLADPETHEGRALRQRLLETTGLSAAGIELGLQRSLEVRASPAQLAALLARSPPAARAHVLLSGNVFVAALRAIAIGVASSERVSLRASRRDPALAEALHGLAPELFELVAQLEPAAGDHVWAYGSDETLSSLRTSLPRGVWLHGHGHGLGAVVVEAAPGNKLVDIASAIALDTVLFDQRGCLSPRVVCVVGTQQQTRELAEALAGALSLLEHQVPPGPRTSQEASQTRLARDSDSYAFETFEAGQGWVSLGREAELRFSSAPRCLHVVPVARPVPALTPFAAHLTCIGASAGAALHAELQRSFAGARLVAPGEMQRPPLDGPVDLRQSASGLLLS